MSPQCSDLNDHFQGNESDSPLCIKVYLDISKFKEIFQFSVYDSITRKTFEYNIAFDRQGFSYDKATLVLELKGDGKGIDGEIKIKHTYSSPELEGMTFDIISKDPNSEEYLESFKDKKTEITKKLEIKKNLEEIKDTEKRKRKKHRNFFSKIFSRNTVSRDESKN
ncbi:hypothetical protein CDIK_2966 [Cucumispora dikerogammari]|nr:hypothetical protein CDIK_2966 [Cucumispora dikerogammari]